MLKIALLTFLFFDINKFIRINNNKVSSTNSSSNIKN